MVAKIPQESRVHDTFLIPPHLDWKHERGFRAELQANLWTTPGHFQWFSVAAMCLKLIVCLEVFSQINEELLYLLLSSMTGVSRFMTQIHEL